MNKTYFPVRAVNVCFTLHHQGQWSRFQILNWINSEIGTQIHKIEDLCSGAAYCCLMDKLFPGTINMVKVKYQANQEYEFLGNFRLVQNAFAQVRADAQIPMTGLVKGRLIDNLEFVTWFRRFYEHNFPRLTRHEYNPLVARGNQSIGFGPSRPPTSEEIVTMRCHCRYVKFSNNYEGNPQGMVGQTEQVHSDISKIIN